MAGSRDVIEFVSRETLSTVEFGELERKQARQLSDLSGDLSRETGWTVASMFCAIAVVGVLVTVGPGGYIPGLPGSAAMDPVGEDSRQVLMPLSFLLGAIGQGMLIVTWWRDGRLRSPFGIIVPLIALVCCGAILRWFATTGAEDPVSFVLLWVVAGVSVVALALQLFASRRGNVYVAQNMRFGERMRALPESQQRAIIAQREEMLGILVKRKKVSPREAEHAMALPLGDLWRAEKKYRSKYGKSDDE